ncbi:MAG: sodium:solute symporter family protein [Sedimentisphaerales bacterium]
MTETIAVIAIYFGFLIVFGFISSRKIKSASDFIVAGRSIGFFGFALLMMGSTASGGTTLGVPSLGFTGGWPTFWEQFFLPLSCCVCLMFFGVKLNRVAIKRNYLTVEDYFCERYYSERSMRLLSPIFAVVVSLIYLMAQYRSIGIVLQELLNINYLTALIISAIIITIYVLLGGLHAISFITLFHVLLIIVGVVVATPFIIAKIPDFNRVLGEIDSNMLQPYYPQKYPPYEKYAFFTPFYILSFFLFLTFGIASAPHVINNVLTVKERNYFKWSPLFVFIIFFVAMSLFKIDGFAARALNETGKINVEQSDFAFIATIKFVFPQFLWVFMGVVILAAVVSTTDRLMLTVGNCISWGIYKRYINKNAEDKTITLINRLTIVIGTIIAVLMVIKPPQLLIFLIWTSIGIMFSSFTIPLVGGLYWRRATKEAGIIAMSLGFVSAMVFAYIHYFITPLPLHFSFFACLISAVTFVVISLITSAPPKEVLENTETGFYIWGPKE